MRAQLPSPMAMSIAYTTLFDAYPDPTVVPTDHYTYSLRQGSDAYDGPGAGGELLPELFALSYHPRCVSAASENGAVRRCSPCTRDDGDDQI